MRIGLGVICFAISAICAFFAGAGATEPRGGQFVSMFFPMSGRMAGNLAAAVIFLALGIILLSAKRRHPETPEEIASNAKDYASARPHRAWEWALLLNGIFAAAMLFALFNSAVGGGSAAETGALLFTLIIQLAVSLILIVAFFFKSGKTFTLFIPGLAMFMCEAALIVLVFVFGKPA